MSFSSSITIVSELVMVIEDEKDIRDLVLVIEDEVADVLLVLDHHHELAHARILHEHATHSARRASIGDLPHCGRPMCYSSTCTTMALHPGIGTPVLDRLGPRDVPEVLSFLEDEPVLNVYLIALVLRDALARPNDAWWGARREGRLSALLFVGAHSGAVLPAGDDPQAHRLLGQRASEAKLARPTRLPIDRKRH